jgi:hypothetical protein
MIESFLKHTCSTSHGQSVPLLLFSVSSINRSFYGDLLANFSSMILPVSGVDQKDVSFFIWPLICIHVKIEPACRIAL